LDTNGNLFIGVYDYNSVIKINLFTSGSLSASIAGTGVMGFSGDGGPATSATMNGPIGLWIDVMGNIYLNDQNNYRIRKIDGNGIITSIMGALGSATDDVPATSSCLKFPGAVFGDSSGSIYISDTGNNRIRKVATNGIITTIAGPGTNNILGDNGPAVSAYLWAPYGLYVATDGTIYVVDSGNNRIRKISSMGIISTYCGNGLAYLSGDGGPVSSATIKSPYGILLSSTGFVYIADSGNHRVRVVDTTGKIYSIAGTGVAGYGGFGGDGGFAINASSSNPRGVVFDSFSNSLFFVDSSNTRIRKVSLRRLFLELLQPCNFLLLLLQTLQVICIIQNHCMFVKCMGQLA
jgi:hypothetical protein